MLVLKPELSIVAITLALFLYLSVTNQYFFQSQNLLNITEANATIGIAAAFATLIVIGGGIDLTPVVVFVITGIVCQTLLSDGLPTPIVVAVGILAGGAVGFLNGALITVGDLNPFIVTLGVNFLLTGLAFVVTNGNGLLITRQAFLNIGQTSLVLGIPTATVIMVVAFVVAAVLLRYTRFGIHVYAVGGDAAAARLSGVRVVRTKMMLYVLGGLAAGLAGVVLAAASGSVAAFQASGANDLLTILAAVIIGGTALEGGRGSVFGTFLGVFLLGLITNGLVLENISSFWQPVVTGIILLFAIVAEGGRRRLARRRGWM